MLGDAFLMVPTLIPQLGSGFPAIVLLPARDSYAVAREVILTEANDKAIHKHLYAALAETIAARNANPLMPEPHLTLGLYVKALASADQPRTYFERVAFLAPRMPELWYHRGAVELADNHSDKAWQDWRKCLSLADRFLDLILADAARELRPQELIDKVIPERGDLLVKAAVLLYPKQKEIRKVFHQAALAALQRQPDLQSPAQLRLKMNLQREFGFRAQAYQTAHQLLLIEPLATDVRVELAKMYIETKNTDAAKREIDRIMVLDPRNDKIPDLLKRLNEKNK
jgi:tetratricopeptide (TPR) repeat protein